MTLYRVLRNLKTGHGVMQRGSWFPGDSMDAAALATLLRLEAVAELNAPPLAELPEFNAITLQALQDAGVVNADQLLEQPIDEMSRQSGLTLDELKRWRAIAARWLTVDDPHG